MISRLLDIFEANGCAPESTRFVAGVSGGVDSTVMLYILKQLKCDVTVVHVNYKKRGNDSENDATLVENTSREYGFDFRKFEYTMDDISSPNFQESARNFRREKFIQVADECNANVILLAQHLDDQIETILQKILKGAGLNAVIGMKVLEDRYFRPMLSISKQEIIDFAHSHSIKWNEDYSNQDSSYARNWIRNEFSQKLDTLFPGWTQNIIKHANRLGAVNELLEILTKEKLHNDSEFPISFFDTISNELQLLVLHYWLNRCNLYVSEGTLLQVQRLISAQAGTKVIMDSQFELIRERNRLKLVRSSVPGTATPIHISKADLRNVQAKFNCKGLQLEIQLIDSTNYKKATYQPASLKNVEGGSTGNIKTVGRTEPGQTSKLRNKSFLSELSDAPGRLHLNADTLTFPLTFQSWQHGDKFKPLGMNSLKLISDLLTDRKIDSSQKNNALKITDFDGKICAVIFPHPTTNGEMGNIGADYKVTDQTNSIIEIHITQYNEL